MLTYNSVLYTKLFSILSGVRLVYCMSLYLIYRTLFYVNMYGTHKHLKTVRFFLAHPVVSSLYDYLSTVHVKEVIHIIQNR